MGGPRRGTSVIDRQTGPIEVHPNTLRDEAVPNTFRSRAGPDAVERQALNSGGGNAGPPRRATRPQFRLWAYVAFGLLIVLVALYLLGGTP